MAENLQIYGDIFNNVPGIKVIDANGNQLIYNKGHYTINDWPDPEKPVGKVIIQQAYTDDNYYSNGYAYQNKINITEVEMPNAKCLPQFMFQNCSNLYSFKAPLLEHFGYASLTGSKISYIILPNVIKFEAGAMQANSSLIGADFGNPNAIPNIWGGNTWSWSGRHLNLIILRYLSIFPIQYDNSIISGTSFESGQPGGTIYIPKFLYDHLGDGSQYDYKAATNWSTIDGNGMITWAQIQGSYYQTHYVDGTEIPTE